MNIWLKNAKKNLLPLSNEKSNLSKALTEWSFTGETIDYEKPDHFCQLCEMEGLRYHFQIANALQNELWVGSKCIERFDIQVLDEEGAEVSKSDKEKYLKNKLRNKHIQNILMALEEHPSFKSIKAYKKIDLDRYCLASFQKSEINARILNYLFTRLDEEQIIYNKRFFTIDIRSNYNKKKLISLNEVQFQRIKGSLTRSQIDFYKKN